MAQEVDNQETPLSNQQPFSEPVMERDPSVPLQGYVDVQEEEDSLVDGAFDDEEEQLYSVGSIYEEGLPFLVGGVDPLASAANTGTDILKGVASGVAEAGTSAWNLIRSAAWESAKALAATQIGSQAANENAASIEADGSAPALTENAQIPDWLRPDSMAGGLVNGFSQYYTSRFILGAVLGPLKAVQGLGNVLKSAPVAKAIEDYPKVVKALQMAGTVGKEVVTGAAIDFGFFNADEGNVIQAIGSIYPESWVGGKAIKKSAADATPKESEGELAGRVKNAAAGGATEVALGTAIGVAAAVKKLKKSWEALQKTDFSKLPPEKAKMALDRVNEDKAILEKEIEIVKNESMESSLDTLTKGNDAPIIIENTDTLMDAVRKQQMAWKKTRPIDPRVGMEEAALENLKRQGEAAAAGADASKITKHMEEKLKAGEPIDIKEAVAAGMPPGAVPTLDEFTKLWATVVSNTASATKRYQSNKTAVQRATEILGVGLSDGSDGAALSAIGLESVLASGTKNLTATAQVGWERLAAMFYRDTVLVPANQITAVDLQKAYAAGDTKVIEILGERLRNTHDQLARISSFEQQVNSEAGRLLQLAKKKELSSEESQEITRQLNAWKTTNNAVGEEIPTEVLADVYANAEKQGNVPALNKALVQAQKIGDFTIDVLRANFYNNVLGAFSTLKSIVWGNTTVRALDLTSQWVAGTKPIKGADGSWQLDTTISDHAWDQMEGAARYMVEGITAGIHTLVHGDRAPGIGALDATPVSPFVLSRGELESRLGVKVEGLAGRAIDLLGHTIQFSTNHVIGSVDTAFKVANLRGYLWADLKRLGKAEGMTANEASAFAAAHIDDVTQDVIATRSTKFDASKTPLVNKVLNLEKLRDIDYKMTGDLQQSSLATPLKEYKSSTIVPVPKEYSQLDRLQDRWAYKAFSQLQGVAATNPIAKVVGTYLAPFTGTMVNSLTYSADMVPTSVVGGVGAYQRQVLQGLYGPEAAARLRGKQLIGSTLGILGGAAMANGMIGYTPAGMQGKSGVQAIDREGTYSLRVGDKNFQFQRLAPVSEAFFIPARIGGMAVDAYQGERDVNTLAWGVVTTLGEVGGTSRYAASLVNTIGSLTDPSQQGFDKINKNLIVPSVTNTIMPFPRLANEAGNFSNPYSRDKGFDPALDNLLGNVWSNYSASAPWTKNSPNYDKYGQPKPNDDFLDSAEAPFNTLIKTVTPIGVTYRNTSPVAEFEKQLSQQGITLAAPMKIQQMNPLGGTPIPVSLDLYKDPETNESLWDVYNKKLSTITYAEHNLGGPAKEKTLTEQLNDVIKGFGPEETGPVTTYNTGKRRQIKGTKFTEVARLYSKYKEFAIKDLEADIRAGKYSRYINHQGNNVMKVSELEELASQAAKPSYELGNQ